MADLEGTDLNVGPRRLSITPVRSAQPGQDATEYVFETCPGPDGCVWSRTFSVADWFTQQDDVWVLARAFAETPVLLQTRIPISLFRTDGGMPAKLCVNAHWLQVALVGIKSQRWVAVVVFAQETSTPDLFRRFRMRTDVEKAARFGQELEQEIIAACPNWAAERKLTP